MTDKTERLFLDQPEAALSLAHALRTPLTSLALGLGLIQEEALGPLNEAQREVVRTLVADVARLSNIVRRELRIERLGAYAGSVELVRTDLGALVEHAVEPLLPQAAERSVRVSREMASGVEAVVDPVKMGWVVASVLGNALRYSPAGGTVAVRLTRTPTEAEITIADSGPGMDPSVAARIFDRGGGLGLFLAREIVEAHGGKIMVVSAVGQGTSFTVQLPVA